MSGIYEAENVLLLDIGYPQEHTARALIRLVFYNTDSVELLAKKNDA